MVKSVINHYYVKDYKVYEGTQFVADPDTMNELRVIWSDDRFFVEMSSSIESINPNFMGYTIDNYEESEEGRHWAEVDKGDILLLDDKGYYYPDDPSKYEVLPDVPDEIEEYLNSCITEGAPWRLFNINNNLMMTPESDKWLNGDDAEINYTALMYHYLMNREKVTK